MKHPSRSSIFTIGILIGMALSDYVLYFRLKKPEFLREMILYLNDGDLSIFSGLGTISLLGAVIGLGLIYAINNYAKTHDSAPGGKE